MNFTNLASIVLVLSLALLPTVIAAFVNGPRDVEPEHEYDYR